MNKEIEIPKGYEARIEGNKVIIEQKESEDERIRKEIIEFINWAESRGSIRCGWIQKKRPAEWIAYLEKQKEQKPAEWSEEDEKMIQSLILEIDKYVFFAGIESKKIINFLKSISLLWKPGEEQMNVLKEAVFYFGNSWVSHKQEVLESLYNDLKKL